MSTNLETKIEDVCSAVINIIKDHTLLKLSFIPTFIMAIIFLSAITSFRESISLFEAFQFDFMASFNKFVIASYIASILSILFWIIMFFLAMLAGINPYMRCDK